MQVSMSLGLSGVTAGADLAFVAYLWGGALALATCLSHGSLAHGCCLEFGCVALPWLLPYGSCHNLKSIFLGLPTHRCYIGLGLPIGWLFSKIR